jgi:hypothetical protein
LTVYSSFCSLLEQIRRCIVFSGDATILE